MVHSTRTPEGEPNQCPLCGKTMVLEPSVPPGDAPCPHCGSLVWFPITPEVTWSAGFPVYTVLPAEAQTKEQVIHAVVGHLVEAGHLSAEESESIVATFLKRESLGSTGIGCGVAIPSIMHPSVDRVVGALAKVPGGVEFDSVDGRPVYLICLLVKTIDRIGDNIRAFEAVVRSLRSLVFLK
jgi:nitrogen PTS system EIIA component